MTVRVWAALLLACSATGSAAAQTTNTQQTTQAQSAQNRPKEIHQESRAAVVRAADRILTHTAADGAITMAPVNGSEGHVVPYFSHFAGIGLADAYRLTHDRRYLRAARRWAAWYEAHLNADGTIYDYTGTSGAWKSTGKYDSSDAYAAGYHELVLAIYRASPNRTWLKQRVPFLKKALSAVKLTLQPIGLTEARPDYPWMYTMDNVSVIRGLRALTATARILNDRALETTASHLADTVTDSLERNLWDANKKIWLVGLYPDGTKADGLKDWYPDIMANLLVIGWMPPSVRNKELYGRLHAQFGSQIPNAIGNADNLDHALWWTYASLAAGDAATSGRLIRLLQQFDASVKTIDNVGYLGDICRILTTESASIEGYEPQKASLFTVAGGPVGPACRLRRAQDERPDGNRLLDRLVRP